MSVEAGTPVQARPVERPPSFHLLAKPSGSTCNIDCAYCFFLSKEALYPNDKHRMSEATLESYIRQLIEAAPHARSDRRLAGRRADADEARFLRARGRTGRKIPAARARRFSRRSRPTASCSTTPGAPSSRSTISWSVSASTGRASCTTPTGATDEGQGTFDLVMRGLALSAQATASSSTSCAPSTPPTRSTGATSIAFSATSLGAKWMQFIPIVERATEETLAIANQGWSDQRGGQAPALHADRRPRHRTLGRRRAIRPLSDRRFRGMGAARRGPRVRPALRRDARGLFRPPSPVHPCADLRLWAGARAQWRRLHLRPFRRAGLEARQHPRRRRCIELVASPADAQIRRGQARPADRTVPRTARCGPLCNGGCPKDRFALSKDGEPGHNYLCAGLELFFTHTRPLMGVMGQLLKRGRPPADVMLWVKNEDSSATPIRPVRAAMARSSSSATATRRLRRRGPEEGDGLVPR